MKHAQEILQITKGTGTLKEGSHFSPMAFAKMTNFPDNVCFRPRPGP